MAVLTALLWSAALPILLRAQSISPSNSIQDAAPPGSEQIQIVPTQGPPNLSLRVNLAALTVNASSSLTSNDLKIGTPLLVNVNSQSSIQQTTSTTFAVIECDPAAAPGNLQPIDVVKQAIARNALAIILYSTAANYCALQTGTGVPDSYPIYSTTNPNDYQQLARGFSNFSPTGSPSGQWVIGKKSTLDNNNSNMSSNNNQNYAPGGPSPSTAVAMIILYSITGVITALFLVIIITGAVRAHRHPERYGPRNVLGRPRQSRARGLARAMLETLPIVKFGEKEDDPKTGDVEMADSSTAHARHVDETLSSTGTEDLEPASRSHDTPTHSADKSDSAEIAAAGEAAARKSPEPAPSVDDDSLGCSICTEDFERGQDVRVLPCKHQFHPACIDPWLLNVSGTCPLCRIDLRPVTSRDNNLVPDSASATSDNLPPPLDADAAGTSSHRASRRMSGFWEVLNPHRMQRATPEERIEALRRVREQRGGNAAEELETRRRRRLTARLGETFGVRTRARGTSPSGSAEIPATVTENPASPTTAAPPTTSTNTTRLRAADVAPATTEPSTTHTHPERPT